MIKKITTLIAVLAVVFALLPVETYAAAKTVKMTGYNQVLVEGNTAYCSGGDGLYKVTLKKGKPVKKEKILGYTEEFGDYVDVSGMTKKGKYIFCQMHLGGGYHTLYRVKVSNGLMTELASYEGKGKIKYVIKGKKIYFKPVHGKKMYMKLNGLGKKSTSVSPKMTTKKTNKSGYSVVSKTKGKLVYFYLKTPKGKIKLGFQQDLELD